MKPKHTLLAALLCGVSQAQTADHAKPEKKPVGDAQVLGEMVVTGERSVPDVYRTLESEGGLAVADAADGPAPGGAGGAA